MILERENVLLVRELLQAGGMALAEEERGYVRRWLETETGEIPDELCPCARRVIDFCQLANSGRPEVLRDHYGLSDEVIASLHFAEYDTQVLKELKKKLKVKGTPPRKMYISDLHFYHGSLNRQMDERGFADYQEMNRYMIGQWNAKVNPKDEVYILGDLSVAKGEATGRILEQLAGKKYLVIGNHDRFLEDKEFKQEYFRWVKDYAEIRDNGRKVVLSHYPVFCYNGQYSRDESGAPSVWMLYGHVHNTYDEVLIDRFIKETQASRRQSRYDTEPRPIPCQMINCFCMFADYQPLTLDEWIETDRVRREKMPASGNSE